MRPIAVAVVLAGLAVGPVLAQDDFSLFFGLLHSQTSLSDGIGTPAEAFEMARAAGLDFFAVTEHNHNQAGGSDGIVLTSTNYLELQGEADNRTQDGAFVAIYGQEVSSISKGNHVNVFNSSTIVDVANGDFRDLYDRYLVEHPEVAFLQFNHPNIHADLNPNTSDSKRNNDYGIDDYNQSYQELVAASDRYVALIELIIGPAFLDSSDKVHHDGTHESDYLFYLNQGFRLAPSVGQDNHKRNWGMATHARLGLWASELTRDEVFSALRSRRTYASEDENVRVKLKLGETWMGDAARLEEGAAAELVLSIEDPDEPDADYSVALFYDDSIGDAEAQMVDFATFTGDTEVTFAHTPEFGSYYFARITQRSNEEIDPDDIWTAPIWVAPAEDDDPGEEHNETGSISWEQAEDFIGQEKTVVGRVVQTHNAGSVLFINFDQDFWSSLSLVVFAEDFDDFGGADALAHEVLGRELTVRGEISLFRGRPQLILRDASQLLGMSD